MPAPVPTFDGIGCSFSMSFVNDILSRLFPGENKPVVVESDGLLTERQAAAYAKWIVDGEGEALRELLYESYRRKSLGLSGPAQLFMHRSNGASGFYFTLTAPFKAGDALYIQEWIGSKIQTACGYRQVHTSYRTRERSGEVEATRLLYFKPQFPKGDPPYTQLYGNLHLELFFRGHQPVWIKLMAFYYTDSMYTDAVSFEGIWNELFGGE